MTIEALKSTHPNFFIRFITNLVRKIIIKTPSFENLLDFGKLFKFSNESSWVEINGDLKLYRFSTAIPKNEFSTKYSISNFERFRPILLIHGYQSSHISWNWLVLKLWEDGFRQIYALEMADYRKGFDHNMGQLINVINYLLSFQLNYKKIDVIAHSMGGLVTRQYLKLAQGALFVRLFISLGSPFKGVFKFWGVLASLDDATESAKDIRDKIKLDVINDAQYEQSFYLLTQVNIIGSLRRYFNTDGLFKNYPLNDMINFTVPTTHFNLNKTEKSYNLIKEFFFKQIWMYKIRLLTIHKKNILEINSANLFSLKVSLRFLITVKDPNSEKILSKLYFPTKDRDELYFDTNEPFIPTDPIIIFSGYSSIKNSKIKTSLLIEISLVYSNKITGKASIKIHNPSENQENVDYISFSSTITELNMIIQANFAITRYILD
jgi:pimeloyl-ACP methyl ester carboxylesterase